MDDFVTKSDRIFPDLSCLEISKTCNSYYANELLIWSDRPGLFSIFEKRNDRDLLSSAGGIK